ncbi:MAG: nucleotide exchange factor GrpE [Caldilineaceae bacterium]|nr:nucleotide exchange factor GrpE [Caldilineaceae bacterium]MCB0094606.1 nucleotide exchange factor GrpE [Caldilineaceae bacterium]MCB0144464.1 nucleotide exchange factor GrpE [Caldilineaceae bacterium]
MPENVENIEEVVVEAETSELADEKAASNGHTPKAAQATAGATDAQPAEAETAGADEEVATNEPAEPVADEQPDSAAIIQALQEQLVQAEAKAKEHFDTLQRTAAEFQNSKRRQEKVLADSIDRASMHLIQRLLPVLDDLDLAFRNQPESLGETENAWVAGFQQIQKKLMHILDEESVTAIPLTGVFDPNRHEAISSEPSDDVESGHIIETLRIGYEYKGRVLRPAMVRVAM